MSLRMTEDELLKAAKLHFEGLKNVAKDLEKMKVKLSMMEELDKCSSEHPVLNMDSLRIKKEI